MCLCHVTDNAIVEICVSTSIYLLKDCICFYDALDFFVMLLVWMNINICACYGHCIIDSDLSFPRAMNTGKGMLSLGIIDMHHMECFQGEGQEGRKGEGENVTC